jgi:hypothetical protein
MAAAAVGIAQLKNAWLGRPGSSLVLACASLLASLAAFGFAFGSGLGVVLGLSVAGLAGLVASAVSADLGAPRRLRRTAPRPRSAAGPGERLGKAWRFLLAGPIALAAGLALGLAALPLLPGADADRMVFATLIAITGASALVGWTCCDPSLRRSTLVGAGGLTAAGMLAAVLRMT